MPTEDDIKLFAFRVWSYKQGEVVSLMVHLGDRLGLYRAMAGAGSLTAPGLAERTGLHERWLREWLRSQAAAGLVISEDGDSFRLADEAVPVLVDEEGSVWFAAGAFQGGMAPPEIVDRLADAFRTGIGLSYDDLGPSAAHEVERMLAPWTRLALVPVVLPALEGVSEKLRAGAEVADVGCGAGVAVLTMAAAFPRSKFVGYDPSRHAIARARERQAETGLENVSFLERPAEELTGSYDLIMTLDCLHDMPHPDRAAAAMRRAIKEEGTWLVKEIRSGDTWADNLANPLLAMMYGTSVATCMSSALSEPGGAGLGTLGLSPSGVERLAKEAGFTSVTRHDFDDPANLYYEIHP